MEGQPEERVARVDGVHRGAADQGGRRAGPVEKRSDGGSNILDLNRMSLILRADLARW